MTASRRDCVDNINTIPRSDLRRLSVKLDPTLLAQDCRRHRMLRQLQLARSSRPERLDRPHRTRRSRRPATPWEPLAVTATARLPTCSRSALLTSTRPITSGSSGLRPRPRKPVIRVIEGALTPAMFAIAISVQSRPPDARRESERRCRSRYEVFTRAHRMSRQNFGDVADATRPERHVGVSRVPMSTRPLEGSSVGRRRAAMPPHFASAGRPRPARDRRQGGSPRSALRDALQAVELRVLADGAIRTSCRRHWGPPPARCL